MVYRRATAASVSLDHPQVLDVPSRWVPGFPQSPKASVTHSEDQPTTDSEPIKRPHFNTWPCRTDSPGHTGELCLGLPAPAPMPSPAAAPAPGGHSSARWIGHSLRHPPGLQNRSLLLTFKSLEENIPHTQFFLISKATHTTHLRNHEKLLWKSSVSRNSGREAAAAGAQAERPQALQGPGPNRVPLHGLRAQLSAPASHATSSPSSAVYSSYRFVY